jgi:LAO/AO transport system kinase
VESIALTALRERVGDLRSRGGEHGLDELAADVVAGRTDPYAAADRLLAGLTGG